jgi:hypothetical protein
LSDGQPVQQTEASAAYVERATGFANEKLGVELRRQRRITAMRFAGGDDPIEFLSATTCRVERLLCGSRSESEFIFVSGGVGERLDSGAKAEFAGRHTEGAVDFLGGNYARADYRGRTQNNCRGSNGFFHKSEGLNGFRRRAVCELLGLPAKRILQSHISLGNEEGAAVKGGEVVQLEEAIFGFALRFELAAAADVHGRNAAIEQRGTNHQKTVTLQRIFLGAHEGDVGCGVQLQRASDPGAKILRFAAFLVIHDAVRMVGERVGGTAAESITEEFVADSGGGQAGFERLAIELRKPETAGAAADIAEDFYVVCNQDFQKLIELKARMADGEERWIGRQRLHGKVTQRARSILPKGTAIGKGLHHNEASLGLAGLPTRGCDAGRLDQLVLEMFGGNGGARGHGTLCVEIFFVRGDPVGSDVALGSRQIQFSCADHIVKAIFELVFHTGVPDGG